MQLFIHISRCHVGMMNYKVFLFMKFIFSLLIIVLSAANAVSAVITRILLLSVDAAVNQFGI